jgi:selenocysteine-specific elongation factor
MTGDATFAIVGHVDHGKSALVEALTGTSTDRLAEERERGMSIVLGFAYLPTDQGGIDLIDVPGHEDFIRAMVAGATGIDGIVLVIAANEGIMPQTREHFDIARLLGIERGIVAINKCDLATPEQLSMLANTVEEFVAGTFLETAPVVQTSAVAQTGIAELRAALAGLAGAPLVRPTGRNFLLPLDRVFTIRGFGLVATGTLRGGTLRTGDSVEILPQGITATVRGLERHNRPVDEAHPGQRVAVNLRGADRDTIERGNTLAAPGYLHPSTRIDVELCALDEEREALANGARVRVLAGAAEILARVRLLDRAALLPGTCCFAQLRLESTIAALSGDRFLVRTYSPMRTIAGGRVLDIAPPRRRRFDPAVVERLRRQAAGDATAILNEHLDSAGERGIDIAIAAQRLALSGDDVRALMRKLGAVFIDDRAVARARFEDVTARVLGLIERFHDAHPFERGIQKHSARTRLTPAPDADLWNAVLETLAADGRIVLDDRILALPGFDPLSGLTDRERRIAAEIESAFRGGGIAPPAPTAVLGADRQKENLFRMLLERGRLVRLNTYARGSQIVLHAETLTVAQQRLADHFPPPRTFTVADVRDLFGSTRRHITPLMEHLDAAGFTIRAGDTRRLQAR